MRTAFLSLLLLSPGVTAGALEIGLTGSVFGWMTGVQTEVLTSTVQPQDWCNMTGGYCRKYEAYITWAGNFTVNRIDLENVDSVKMDLSVWTAAERPASPALDLDACFEPGNIAGDLLNYQLIRGFPRWNSREKSCVRYLAEPTLTRLTGESTADYEARVITYLTNRGGTVGAASWIKNPTNTNWRITGACIISQQRVTLTYNDGTRGTPSNDSAVLCGPVSNTDNRPKPVSCSADPFEDIDFGTVSINELRRGVSSAGRSAIRCDDDGGNYKVSILRSSMKDPNLLLTTYVGLSDGVTPNDTSVSGKGKFTNVNILSTLKSQTLPSGGLYSGDVILNIEFY